MSEEEAGWGPKGLENFYAEQKARPEKPTTKIGRPVGAKNKPKSDKRIAGQEQVVALEPVRRKATPAVRSTPEEKAVTIKPTKTGKAKTKEA